MTRRRHDLSRQHLLDFTRDSLYDLSCEVMDRHGDVVGSDLLPRSKTDMACLEEVVDEDSATNIVTPHLRWRKVPEETSSPAAQHADKGFR